MGQSKPRDINRTDRRRKIIGRNDANVLTYIYEETNISPLVILFQ